jgi:hypothetical protein
MSFTHSQRLRMTVGLAEPRLNAASQAFWAHPELAEIMPVYFVALYASMRATVPLLRRAAERARELAPSDAVSARLVPYFEQHAREELHHDEWLLEDMRVIGMDPEKVARVPAPADVAELIGAQYYWVEFSHPVSVLGCFAVLEGSPPDADVLDGIVERTGIPREALRTIYKHAVLDPHHRDDLNDLIDSLPLTSEHAAMMGLSAIQTVNRLCSVVERIVGGGVVVAGAEVS